MGLNQAELIKLSCILRLVREALAGPEEMVDTMTPGTTWLNIEENGKIWKMPMFGNWWLMAKQEVEVAFATRKELPVIFETKFLICMNTQRGTASNSNSNSIKYGTQNNGQRTAKPCRQKDVKTASAK